jgi:hypothetical protein
MFSELVRQTQHFETRKPFALASTTEAAILLRTTAVVACGSYTTADEAHTSTAYPYNECIFFQLEAIEVLLHVVKFVKLFCSHPVLCILSNYL